MEKLLWYNERLFDIFKILNSSFEGLSTTEAQKRLSELGENILPKKKSAGILKILFRQFLNPFIYVLTFAAILSLIIGDKKDSFFIFLIILINTLIGAYQEYKAEKSAESLQNLLKLCVKTKRDGKIHSINSNSLVQGDIIILESGNKVPADIRLISSNTLIVDESFLTGESSAVEKKAEDITAKDLDISERYNMLFAGSIIVSGRCTGIIVETGINTEVGKIAKTITTLKTSKAPLVYRMEKLSKDITYIIGLSCILIALIEFTRGITFIEIFFIIIALAVSAIPEGLPAAVTVALSIGMYRMSKRNVIIRKLTAVEGLGSCTCIASDKTGTLTVNKQTVRLISFLNNEEYAVTGEGYVPKGNILSPDNIELVAGSKKQLDMIIKNAVISNEANLHNTEKGWRAEGDAVDAAILIMAYKYGFDYIKINSSIHTVTDIPFEPEKAYSARFYSENEHTNIAMKGAFEVVQKFCSNMIINGKISEINSIALNNQAQNLAAKGYRIISVATGKAKEEKQHYTHNDISDLTFLGFICLIDPLRPESIMAITKCRKAGVKVIMITGDHQETALAIAKELKIARSRENVITGLEIEHMDEDELSNTISEKTVFARVLPLQKLKIVDCLIKSGNYVAVTGDGVNDSPALKKAHIGIAMGSGSDISKDIASVIIVNDDFYSIVTGIEEGRYTYDNIRKVIYLLVSTGLAEIILFFLSLIFVLPLPLMAVQLLWLNLVTNGIQGVALAFEKGEPNTMKRPPRKPDEEVFNALMIQEILLSASVMAIISFLCWFFLLKTGWSEFQARNAVLLLMVMFENIQSFNCRSEFVSTFKIPFKNNPLLIISIILAQLLHIISMQIPFMQQTLKIEPIQAYFWLILLSAAAVLLLVMELFKKYRRLKDNNLQSPV